MVFALKSVTYNFLSGSSANITMARRLRPHARDSPFALEPFWLNGQVSHLSLPLVSAGTFASGTMPSVDQHTGAESSADALGSYGLL